MRSSFKCSVTVICKVETNSKYMNAKPNVRNRLYLTFLVAAGCLFLSLVPLFAWTNPALASIVSNASTPISTRENLWAPMEIAKPTATPIDAGMLTPKIRATHVVPGPTEALDTLVMEIVDNSVMDQTVSPEEVQYAADGNDDRWIDVNLSEQRVYVYEGDVVVNSFLVSTGLPETPTVTGQYRIRIKVRMQDMSGPGYYLRDVPYVMYFYDEYGFHGTYWHNNFGSPMSRGCVNLTIDDAAWLYNWASIGTLVNVHY